MLWTRPSTVGTRASIPAAVLVFVGSLALPILSYTEHIYSPHPSTILNLYLFFSTLFDVARSRTLWLQHYNGTVASLLVATTVFKGLLVVIESWEKRSALRSEWKSLPPESTSGVFSKFFFWWQISLFRLGFSKSLSGDDLFKLDRHLSSTYLQNKIESAWSKGIVPAFHLCL